MAVRMYQAQLKQLYYAKEMFTNFYFFDPLTGEDGHAEDIAVALATNLVPAINDCQSERVINHSLKVTNVTTSAESFLLGLTGGGTGVISSTNDLPPFLTATIRLAVDLVQFRPTGKIIRYGFLKISGLLDGNIINGIAFDSTFASALGAIVTALLDEIEIGTSVYKFVINRRPNVSTVDPEQQIATVTGSAGYKVGTQNTRK